MEIQAVKNRLLTIKGMILATIFGIAIVGCGESDQSPDSQKKTKHTLSIQENLLYVVGNAVKLLSTDDKLCYNGGVVEKTLKDNDNNQYLSVNDDLTLNFKNCELYYFTRTISGQINNNIEQMEENGGKIKLILETSDLRFGESIISGQFGIDILNIDHEKTITIKTLNHATLETDQGSFVILKNTEISRTENYKTSFWQVNGSGTFREGDSEVLIPFMQEAPWQGYFFEYPHEGIMNIGSEDAGGLVNLQSNILENSNKLAVTTEGETRQIEWNDFVDNYLWSFDNHTSDPVIHGEQNFSHVGVLNDEILDNFPVDGELILVFSRPVGGVDGPERTFGNTQNAHYNYHVPYNISIDGAMVKVSPAEHLIEGNEYQFSSIHVYSEYDNKAVWASIDKFITVNDDMIVDIQAESNLYRFDDFPTLDASGSIVKDGEIVSYEWVDANDVGIVFDNPNSGKTTFRVPDNFVEDLSILVRIYSSNGKMGEKHIQIKYVGEAVSYFFIDSPSKESVGGGKRSYLSDVEGRLRSYSPTLRLNDIVIGYTDSKTWTTGNWYELYLAPPEGQSLQVRQYTKASSSIQNPRNATLAFSSDTSCTSRGEFEVLEIAYKPDGKLDKLAVNFSNTCYLKEKQPVKGKLRFNSSIGINH